jgi:hypothetical protein
MRGQRGDHSTTTTRQRSSLSSALNRDRARFRGWNRPPLGAHKPGDKRSTDGGRGSLGQGRFLVLSPLLAQLLVTACPASVSEIVSSPS